MLKIMSFCCFYSLYSIKRKSCRMVWWCKNSCFCTVHCYMCYLVPYSISKSNRVWKSCWVLPYLWQTPFLLYCVFIHSINYNYYFTEKLICRIR